MVRSGASAKGAIRQWLDLYDIGEDDYSADTAYKKWQRSGWFLQEKNPDFRNKLLKARGSKNVTKSGYYAKSNYPRKALSLSIREIRIEIVAAQAISIISNQLRRMPKSLPNYIRAYLYKEIGGLTDLKISEIMGVNRINITMMRHRLAQRCAHNHFIKQVLQEIVAYSFTPA